MCLYEQLLVYSTLPEMMETTKMSKSQFPWFWAKTESRVRSINSFSKWLLLITYYPCSRLNIMDTKMSKSWSLFPRSPFIWVGKGSNVNKLLKRSMKSATVRSYTGWCGFRSRLGWEWRAIWEKVLHNKFCLNSVRWYPLKRRGWTVEGCAPSGTRDKGTFENSK